MALNPLEIIQVDTVADLDSAQTYLIVYVRDVASWYVYDFDALAWVAFGGGEGLQGLICEGDSLTDDDYIAVSLSSVSWPRQLIQELGDGWFKINLATAGATIANCAARAAACVDEAVNIPSISTLLFFAGTNTIISGGAASDVLSQTGAYCEARRLANSALKIVVIGMLPRGDFNGTQEGYRITVNSTLLSLFPDATAYDNVWTGAAFADAFIDLGADPDIGAPGSYADTDFYAVDEVHLITGGHTKVFGYVLNALRALEIIDA